MLDLDQLADQQARALKQSQESWRSAVWSPEFQKFTTNLSDGEIEQLVTWCPSVEHLHALVRHLEPLASGRAQTPFPVLVELAAESKVSPKDWIKTRLPLKTSP